MQQDIQNIIEYIGIRFLTTDEENEKRQFQKKVRQTYLEFRKSNYDSVKKIENLEISISQLKAEDIYKTNLINELKLNTYFRLHKKQKQYKCSESLLSYEQKTH